VAVVVASSLQAREELPLRRVQEAVRLEAGVHLVQEGLQVWLELAEAWVQALEV
jgi:hypothetical protein